MIGFSNPAVVAFETEGVYERAWADVADHPDHYADEIVGYMDDPLEVLARIIRMMTPGHKDGLAGKALEVEAILALHIQAYATHHAEGQADQFTRSLL